MCLKTNEKFSDTDLKSGKEVILLTQYSVPDSRVADPAQLNPAKAISTYLVLPY
jgi:hypothetical protein